MRFVGSSKQTSPNLGLQVLEMRSSGQMDQMRSLGQDFALRFNDITLCFSTETVRF